MSNAPLHEEMHRNFSLLEILTPSLLAVHDCEEKRGDAEVYQIAGGTEMMMRTKKEKREDPFNEEKTEAKKDTGD